MRLLILAGGLGTRLREETEYKPKPMIEIGGRPILWHIMKIYASQGVNDFVVALGYKGDVIREYFRNFEMQGRDIEFDLAKKTTRIHNKLDSENWKVSLVETGPLTMTGGRLSKCSTYLNSETFMCTYGDGLANVDIQELLAFHRSHGKIATVTAASPVSRFGRLEIDESGFVKSFVEKPIGESWVNAGFFVFEPAIFDYLSPDSILEREPLENLVREGQLVAYKHTGFWQPMDTLREAEMLNEAWEEGAPWKTW